MHQLRLERKEAVDLEIKRLLNIGIIRKVKYLKWLANVVMVKKAFGGWRMCIDFTNLNIACPKGSYPLPSIDKFISKGSRCELLSFMDAYLGYNQIRMRQEDEEKTTFITEKDTICFKVMRFGLKNAGATFQ